MFVFSLGLSRKHVQTSVKNIFEKGLKRFTKIVHDLRWFRVK